MCYSPEADLAAGVIIGAVGIDALAHGRGDRSTIALAALPAVFAAHQAIEAVTWWGLQGRVPASIGEAATTTYLVIAFTVVPFLVPFAVWRCEPVDVRRRWMAPFVVMGSIVAIVLGAGLITEPHSATIGGRFIAYHAASPLGGVVGVLYVVAVCTPLVLTSHRRIVALGVVNIPVVIALWLLLSEGFISLWCVWAAVTSVVIAVHLRETQATRSTGRLHSTRFGRDAGPRLRPH